MITRETVDLLTELMRQADDNAQKTLSAILDELFSSGLSMADIRDHVLQFFPVLVSESMNVASTGAAQWYDMVRVDESSGKGFRTTIPHLMNEQKVTRSVRWAMGPAFQNEVQRSVDRLSNILTYNIKNAGRETVIHNAAKDPARPKFARVPAGKETCSFCDMLASRGFVYQSEKSAGKNNKFHAHCDCVIVPKWKETQIRIEGYNPELLYQRYLFGEKELRARFPDNENPSDEEIAALVRKLLPSVYDPQYKPEPGDISFAARRLAPLSEKQLNHILYGDRNGGGHFYTAAKRNKTHFPPWWTVEDIQQAIEDVQLFGKCYVEDENSQIFEGFSKGVLLRLRIRNGEVGSIFPLQGDGVERYFPEGNSALPLLNFRSEDYPDIYGHRLS